MNLMNIVTPHRVVIPEKGRKVVFLAGPIRGAEDWQETAIDFIAERCPDVLVVSPAHYTKFHRFFRKQLKGMSEKDIVDAGLSHLFESNTAWERFYLEYAAKNGVILFWLPCESELNPRDPKSGPYGRDSYGELGEWRTRKVFEEKLGQKINLVIGGNERFSGLHVIKQNIHHFMPDFVVWNDFKSTLAAAVELLNDDDLE